jgi:hypothetical protein
MTMKIVVNRCFGGFGISRKASEFMAARGNKQAKAEIREFEKSGRWFGYGYSEKFHDGYDRTDPDLVAAVEELGSEASGDHSSLEVVNIPDDVDWEIDDYDGMERVEEKHRSW